MTFGRLVFVMRLICIACVLSAILVACFALYACLWLYMDQLYGAWGLLTSLVLIGLGVSLDTLIRKEL